MRLSATQPQQKRGQKVRWEEGRGGRVGLGLGVGPGGAGAGPQPHRTIPFLPISGRVIGSCRDLSVGSCRGPTCRNLSACLPPIVFKCLRLCLSRQVPTGPRQVPNRSRQLPTGPRQLFQIPTSQAGVKADRAVSDQPTRPNHRPTSPP